ncbi:hypothetical protein DH2020_041236 [Rehmannia glutinosa]|uniref:Uncharacterized protein n=1 Tax=Rehmannia glutinosa TaxID=99300 RepID=A0ABR0US06_REHGL
MSCKNPTSLFLFRFICLQELEASDSAPGVLAAPKIIRVDPESRRSGASPGRPDSGTGCQEIWRRPGLPADGGRGRVEASGDGRVGPGDVGGLEWCVHLRLYLRHVAARGRHARPRRLFFACASDSDRTVFVAGGHDGEKCALKSAMSYNVARDEWSHLPDMSAERDESKGVYHGGKFHVISGYETSAQGRFGTSAESLDVATRRWGPVQEDFLDAAACPRNCADDGDGKLFMARGADMAVREGSSAWRAVAELPSDARNTAYVTAWRGKLLVIGSERFGAPYKTYLLDLKRCKWEKVEADEEFSGHVQSGCCLEL